MTQLECVPACPIGEVDPLPVAPLRRSEWDRIRGGLFVVTEPRRNPVENLYVLFLVGFLVLFLSTMDLAGVGGSLAVSSALLLDGLSCPSHRVPQLVDILQSVNPGYPRCIVSLSFPIRTSRQIAPAPQQWVFPAERDKINILVRQPMKSTERCSSLQLRGIWERRQKCPEACHLHFSVTMTKAISESGNPSVVTSISAFFKFIGDDLFYKISVIITHDTKT